MIRINKQLALEDPELFLSQNEGSLNKNMAKGLSLFKKEIPNAAAAVLSLSEHNVSLTREVQAMHWSHVCRSTL